MDATARPDGVDGTEDVDGPVTVTDVVVERERGLTITYGDGHTFAFGLEELRAGCPCATCRGWRERGEAAWPRAGATAPLRILDAALVGAWGISLRWSDGHDTGIYPWEGLRRWCDGRAAEEPGR